MQLTEDHDGEQQHGAAAHCHGCALCAPACMQHRGRQIWIHDENHVSVKHRPEPQSDSGACM